MSVYNRREKKSSLFSQAGVSLGSFKSKHPKKERRGVIRREPTHSAIAFLPM